MSKDIGTKIIILCISVVVTYIFYDFISKINFTTDWIVYLYVACFYLVSGFIIGVVWYNKKISTLCIIYMLPGLVISFFLLLFAYFFRANINLIILGTFQFLFIFIGGYVGKWLTPKKKI